MIYIESMTKTATRVVGYVGVSTSGQAAEGVSLEAQRTKLEAYAVAMDLELVSIEVDAGISAGSLKRPGLQAALAKLEAGEADALVIVKLDRLTRSTRDLGWLLEKRRFGEAWALLSLNDSIDTRTAGGRLVLNVLTSVAQWEREATGERTKEALQHLKSQGVKLGPAGLGETFTEEEDEHGRLKRAVVDDENETAALIYRLRAEGRTYRQIAEELAKRGRRTKRGGKWYPMTVRKVYLRCAA